MKKWIPWLALAVWACTDVPPPPAVEAPLNVEIAPRMARPVLDAPRAELPARLPRQLAWSKTPLLGGGLAVTPDGAKAVISDPVGHQIFVVDLRRRETAPPLRLPRTVPWRIALGADRAYVSLRQAGAIAVIDLDEAAVSGWIPVCAAPRGLTLADDVLHVACAGGDLLTVDPETGTELDRAELWPDLRDVVVVGERRYVSTFRSAQVLVVEGGEVVDVWTPASEVAGGRVVGRPTVAWRMVRGLRDSIVVLHQQVSTQSIQVWVPGSYEGPPRRGGEILTQITEFEPNGETRAVAILRSSPLAVDVAVGPVGDVLVASRPKGDTGVAQHYYPAGPRGIDGELEAESGPGTAQQQAVAFDAAGNRHILESDPLRLVTIQGGGELALALRPAVPDRGYDVFHSVTRIGAACALCHPEGGDDGNVWRFEGIGDRRTQHLRGGLSGSEPFHWDGDIDDMDHLVADVYSFRMSGRQVNGDGRALARWIDGLPTVRVSAPDGRAVARGAALYASDEVGCQRCHGVDGDPAPLSADVGTGGTFQVPSLRGIAARPPYLHDGCAPTLWARFRDCGSDRHGVTSHLSDDQIDDLIAFMRTL